MRWENGAGVGRKWHQAETSVVALALKAGLSRSLELPQHQETKRRPGRGISATVLTPVSQTPPAFSNYTQVSPGVHSLTSTFDSWSK
jgi:hypothetical protein